ncbi:MAG: hypothetical protein GY762_09925 [Proteobacteria bacterium]|nr:hypothetical protein [Pseudomonadota bacterium]
MKKILTILLNLLVFLSIGCGAKPDRATMSKPPRPIDESLLDLVPENPAAILWVDVTKLRASKLWGAVEELAKSDDGVIFFSDAEEAGFVDPLTQIDEIVLSYAQETKGFPRHGDGDHLLVLLKGTFGARSVIDTLRRDGGDRAVVEGVDPFEIKGFPAVRKSEYIVLAITDRTLVIATPQSAFRVAERVRGESASIEDDPDFADFVIGGPEAAKLRYRKGVVSQSTGDPDRDSEPLELDGLHGLDAALVLGEELDLRANLHMENEAKAAKVEKELRDFRSDFANNMLTVMIGIEWLSDCMAISLSGKSVAISVILDAKDMEELTRLVDRLQKVQELLNTEQQGATPEGTPLKKPGVMPYNESSR